jgi:hypothetical protein
MPAPSQQLAMLLAFDPAARKWQNAYERRYGEKPDVAPGGDYDYEKAAALGVRPEEYPHDPGMPHWPSRAPAQAPRMMGPLLKSPDHETMWMERFMQRFGVDPNEASPEQKLEALRTGVMPGLPFAGG